MSTLSDRVYFSINYTELVAALSRSLTMAMVYQNLVATPGYDNISFDTKSLTVKAPDEKRARALEALAAAHSFTTTRSTKAAAATLVKASLWRTGVAK